MTAIDEARASDVIRARSWPFVWGIVGLCGAYFALELVYIWRMPLVMDEFNYASYVHDLKSRLPYRDFTPTKTVLGFYVQTLALLIPAEPWTGLMLIKMEMALINALVIGIVAFVLAREFRPQAVLWALALLFPMSNFLERSPAIRVDTMTALGGLVSLVLLLRGRSLWAGVLAMLSFLVSQKGIYYILAGNCALAMWLVVNRPRSLRDFLLFNAAVFVTLMLYVGFWSLIAPFSKVWADTFLQEHHYILAFQYTHEGIRDYWYQTLTRNPMFYGLGLGALALLAARCWGRGWRRELWVLLVYAASFAWIPFGRHGLPAAIIPAIAAAGLGIAAIYWLNRGRVGWLDWPLLVIAGSGAASLQSCGYGLVIFALGMLWPLAQQGNHEPARRAEWMLLVYGSVLGALCLWHKAPWPYFFVILIPTVFVVQASFLDQLFTGKKTPDLVTCRRIALAMAIILGIGFPLTRLRHTLPRDSSFQRHMVALGHFLVKPGETYVDGTNMLYRIPQTVEATSWLGALGRYKLRTMSAEQLQEVVRELEREPVKLVINSYRLPNIPDELAFHFIRNFSHLWGNIFVYAPRVEPEEKQFLVKFPGQYRVEGYEGIGITIDGQDLTSGTAIRLDKGEHANASRETFRLHLLPEGLDQVADPRFQNPAILFDNPYTY